MSGTLLAPNGKNSLPTLPWERLRSGGFQAATQLVELRQVPPQVNFATTFSLNLAFTPLRLPWGATTPQAHTGE